MNIYDIHIISNKTKFFITIILSLLMISFIPLNAYAASLTELANQKTEAIKQYEECVSKQSEIQSNINNIQSEIDILNEELKEKEDKLLEMVKNSYISNISPFDVLLSSILSDLSLKEIIINLDYYDKVIDHQNEIVNEVKIAKQVLDDKKSELDRSKAEIDILVSEAEQAKESAVAAYEELKSQIEAELYANGTYTGGFPEGWLTLDEMKFRGVVEANGFRYTYYSELVLPGGGLNIPGRHVADCGCVCNENGYVVVANDVLARGSLVPTPLICHPIGIVLDAGVGVSNGIDIYVH